MSEQKVWIRSHYERFPATVKGAFVLRGVDRDPHQVRLRQASVIEVATGSTWPIDIQPVVLDVAPHLDLFVPFEFPIMELGPGWYGLQCDIDVDGVPGQERPGEHFSVAWPRGSTRRGSIPVGSAVAASDGTKVSIDQIECAGDRLKLHFSAEDHVDLRVRAGVDPLATVDQVFDQATGKGTLITYPAMRTHDDLTVEVRPRAKPRSEPVVIDVRLP